MPSKKSGRLFLIPTTLGSESVDMIPVQTQEIVIRLEHFVVERVRTARRFIRQVSKTKSIDDIQFIELDKRGNNNAEIKSALHWIKDGNDIGLMSEAGAPCIADPGNLLVEAAHKDGIEVIPLVGPSSMFLALMASGLNGQNFAFNGYLPVQKDELAKSLLKMESISKKLGQTQLFMETPYRNVQLWQTAIQHLREGTKFGYAADLTLPTQEILVKPINDWKKTETPSLHKRPTIFMLSAG